MIQRVLLFVAMLLAQGPSVVAQEVPVARLVGPFAETIRAEAPVSGVDVLGLVVFGDQMPRGAEDIFVRNPSGRAVSVCVEMVTRDGRYIASGTFDLPETAPAGYVRIPITERTRYRNILRAAALENFAVLARGWSHA